jgi:hypothetical protein
MGVVRITNLAQVLQGFDLTEKKIDLATFQAVYQCALKIEDQAKVNANTGNHPKGTPRVSGTGPGPNVITGNLNSKIVGQRPVKGFRGYTSTVDSSAEYARAVEVGHPKWKSGVKYPYMEPAAQTLINNGTLNRIFTGAFVTAIRGS